MARRAYRGRAGRRRRPAIRKRRGGIKKARSAKVFRRRRLNNHTFLRAQGCVIANVDGALGISPEIIIGTTDNFPTPTAIVGEVSPYGNTSSWTSSLVFSLSRTANVSELTALYDQYMIKYVDVEFDYSADTGSADDTGTPIPDLVLLTDHDDNAPETRIQQLQSISRITRRSLRKKVVYRVYCRPRLGVGASEATGTILPSTIFKRSWLDCDQSGIPHYGLKVMCYDWPLFNDRTEVGLHMSKPILRVNLKYCLAMKNVR